VTASCAYTLSARITPASVVTRFPVFKRAHSIYSPSSSLLGMGGWHLDNVGEMFTGMDEEGFEVGLPRLDEHRWLL
jgi:hypothetical protein